MEQEHSFTAQFPTDEEVNKQSVNKVEYDSTKFIQLAKQIII